jgi:hypothetical protein
MGLRSGRAACRCCGDELTSWVPSPPTGLAVGLARSCDRATPRSRRRLAPGTTRPQWVPRSPPFVRRGFGRRGMLTTFRLESCALAAESAEPVKELQHAGAWPSGSPSLSKGDAISGPARSRVLVMSTLALKRQARAAHCRGFDAYGRIRRRRARSRRPKRYVGSSQVPAVATPSPPAGRDSAISVEHCLSAHSSYRTTCIAAAQAEMVSLATRVEAT